MKFWDLKTGEQQAHPLGQTGAIFSLSFSPNGDRLAAGDIKGKVKIWKPGESSGPEILMGEPVNVACVALSRDGRLVASGNEHGQILVRKLAQAQTAHPLQGHKAAIMSVAFSPDGNLLASASQDKTVKVWDVASGRPRYTLSTPDWAYSVAISPSGEILAAGTRVTRDAKTVQGQLILWDLHSGEHIQSVDANDDWVTSVAFSPDGQMLATAAGCPDRSPSLDQSVQLWDVRSGRPREKRVLKGHTDAVMTVVFAPDSKTLASAGRDGSLRLWDVATGKLLRTIPDGIYYPNGLVYSPDGRSVIKASDHDNRAIRFWDVETGTLRFTLPAHDETIWSVAISGEGRILATCAIDDTVRLWRAATDDEVRAAGW